MVIAQNTSKVLQEAYQKTNKGLIKLTRQLHNFEQYSRRECLDITSIPSNINKKYLGKFLLCLFMGLESSSMKIKSSGATDWVRLIKL